VDEDEIQYIKGCILWFTSKPSNRKQGLYHSLHIATRPWENCFMYFLEGLATTKKGHEYMFMVFQRFNKMFILIPYKKTLKGQDEEKMFFEQV
jgi:hypothetical protein